MLEKKIFISQQRVICIINNRLVKCDMTMRRTEHFLFVRLIITCWSSAGFTIHVPSTWSRHHHSNRVSMASIIKWACFLRGLKERQDKLLGFWWRFSTGTSEEKITCAACVWRWSEKNVSLLCFCHILVCHTKIKQMIRGSIEQWGNINGTDRQIDRQTYSKLHVCQIKADRLRYMYIKICYSFHKKGYWNVQVYKKTAATSKHF